MYYAIDYSKHFDSGDTVVPGCLRTVSDDEALNWCDGLSEHLTPILDFVKEYPGAIFLDNSEQFHTVLMAEHDTRAYVLKLLVAHHSTKDEIKAVFEEDRRGNTMTFVIHRIIATEVASCIEYVINTPIIADLDIEFRLLMIDEFLKEC